METAENLLESLNDECCDITIEVGNDPYAKNFQTRLTGPIYG